MKLVTSHFTYFHLLSVYKETREQETNESKQGAKDVVETLLDVHVTELFKEAMVVVNDYEAADRLMMSQSRMM